MAIDEAFRDRVMNFNKGFNLGLDIYTINFLVDNSYITKISDLFTFFNKLSVDFDFTIFKSLDSAEKRNNFISALQAANESGGMDKIMVSLAIPRVGIKVISQLCELYPDIAHLCVETPDAIMTKGIRGLALTKADRICLVLNDNGTKEIFADLYANTKITGKSATYLDPANQPAATAAV